jgi:hypothetical protein
MSTSVPYKIGIGKCYPCGQENAPILVYGNSGICPNCMENMIKLYSSAIEAIWGMGHKGMERHQEELEFCRRVKPLMMKNYGFGEAGDSTPENSY